ncbi:GNAT family N-acetyltransferase [Streptomyces sp. NBC_00435]|uniref:GNAT family N-acetyltransferase n=1 Tax=Streptomyces sp. NBC_00435 TaxID=2903649 RepID=UPI002E1B7011
MSTVLTVAATPSAAGLVLRPWEPGDAGALVEAYRDPAMRHWQTERVGGVEDAERWLEAQRLGRESGDRLGFAVYEAPREAPYGSRLVAGAMLKRTAAGPGALEAGYWTVAGARGRGVASRALGALTAWAFEAFAADGLERIELLHQMDNAASCRVAEKTGYALERILPAAPPAFPLDGHLHVRRARSGVLGVRSQGLSSCGRREFDGRP